MNSARPRRRPVSARKKNSPRSLHVRPPRARREGETKADRHQPSTAIDCVHRPPPTTGIVGAKESCRGSAPLPWAVIHDGSYHHETHPCSNSQTDRRWCRDTTRLFLRHRSFACPHKPHEPRASARMHHVHSASSARLAASPMIGFAQAREYGSAGDAASALAARDQRSVAPGRAARRARRHWSP